MTEKFQFSRRLAAEALGTGMLVATVVGSGIMAETLSKDVGIQLLANTLPTGAILIVLITIFGPLSGAHFNPAVSVMFAAKGNLPRAELTCYVAAQIIGGILGTVAAHLMFAMPIIEFSEKVRSGPAQWLAEAIATFGLVGVILGGLRFNSSAIPWLVGLYITAAYWFTASTSFANPAVTIARSITNTFSGITPWDVPEFVVAQLVGMAVGAFVFTWLLEERKA
jgi:glycerol uptake facilitator-like aquaporin